MLHGTRRSSLLGDRHVNGDTETQLPLPKGPIVTYFMTQILRVAWPSVGGDEGMQNPNLKSGDLPKVDQIDLQTMISTCCITKIYNDTPGTRQCVLYYGNF